MRVTQESNGVSALKLRIHQFRQSPFAKRYKRWTRRARQRLNFWLQRVDRTRGPQPLTGLETVPANVRFFANPGPDFEEGLADSDTWRIAREHRPASPRVRAIAYYLPQFHAFAENNAWWGEGFSEWRNVARGTPRFSGHYQPRVPRDLGFYDLNDGHTLKKQAELAQANGIDAFCFYYYWFNGKRLMANPLDQFANADDIDQSFCILWANENWTRTWDGLENDVLIQQDYREQDEAAFIEDTARYMRNERYVRVNGQPLFIVYRPGLIPDARNTLQRWRNAWTKALGCEPCLMMAQGFGDEDPRGFGLDGAVEFPPHKLCAGAPDINDTVHVLDPEFKGHVRSYSAVIDTALSEPAPAFPLIKTVAPHWDNDARREASGMVLHGSTPARYEQWLNGAIDFATQNPVGDESLVFINAWNEWAEGAYLEPDVHYGHAYLNATCRAVHGVSAEHAGEGLLLVGHDAYRHGAQMLLLNLARLFRTEFNREVTVVLKQGGALLPEYRKVANTLVLAEHGGEKALPSLLRDINARQALCNTTVTGDLVPALKQAGFSVVSLIHELPTLIAEYQLEPHAKSIAQHADHVVFPSELVQRGFEQIAGPIARQQHLRPQGTYQQVTVSDTLRHKLRRDLGLNAKDRLVINVGYADLRKGLDRFIETARRMTRNDPHIHFAWVGGVAPDLQRWLEADLAADGLQHRVHLLGYSDHATDYYSAADAFFLTSREDPYPTVVLEALQAGLPIVVFRGRTGCDALANRFGYCVNDADPTTIDNALQAALTETDDTARRKRQAYIETDCRMPDYGEDLLAWLADPQRTKREASKQTSNGSSDDLRGAA